MRAVCSSAVVLMTTVLAGLCRAQTSAGAPGRCSVFGSYHVSTFDGKFMSYSAPCKYELVSPCTTFVNNTFRIRVTNEPVFPNVADSVVIVQYLEVWAEDRTVQIYRNGSIFVQGVAVDAYNYKCRLIAERIAAGVQVSLGSAGLNVVLTQAGGAMVTVSSRYRGTLCGLCGDFDGNPDNDVDDDATAWIVPDAMIPSYLCTRSPSPTPACEQDTQVLGPMMSDPDYCGAFNTDIDKTFENCLNTYSGLKTSILSMCTEDFCNNVLSVANDAQVDEVASGCSPDQCYVNNATAKAAVCRLAEFLAKECNAKGQPPISGWRQDLGCLSSTMSCVSPSVYQSSIEASSVAQSCISSSCSSSSSSSIGSARIAADDGCQCPSGLAWLGNTCVPTYNGRCGCVYGGSSFYKEGEQWIDAACSANMTCKAGGRIDYSYMSCASRAVCRNSAGRGSCVCPEGYVGDGIQRCSFNCQAGTIANSNNDGCVECPIGTYQNISGQTSCYQCPNSGITLDTGSTSIRACIDSVRLLPDSTTATIISSGLDVVKTIYAPDSVLPDGVPFGNSRYRSISVSSNGIVTFGTSYAGETPTDLAQVNLPMIAALWYRQDFRGGAPSSLTISQYNSAATTSSTSYTGRDSTTFDTRIQNLTEAESRLQLIDKVLALTKQIPATYSSRWALQATWKQSVSYPYQWYTTKRASENATYQIVITTDTSTTYVLILYPWNQTFLSKTNLNRKIYMGYNDGKQGLTFYASGSTEMAQIDTLPSNTGRPGFWLFSFSPVLRKSAEGRFCLTWYNQEADTWASVRNSTQRQQGMPPCPCNLAQLRNDPRFILNATSLCAVSALPSGNTYYQMCCYSRTRGFLLNDDMGAGRPLRYSPYRDLGRYMLADFQPFFNCCVASDYCSLYRQCRRADTCSEYRPSQAASAYGDPHFVLLDSSMQYTYNPVGEFHLIKSSAMNVQVRMGYSNASNVEGIGTVFLAVAAKATAPKNSSRVHFEINPNGTDLIVHIQSPDGLADQQYSSMFSMSAPVGTFYAFDGVAVYKSDSGLVAAFAIGCTISVAIKAAGMLEVLTYVPPSFMNMSTAGLMGAYDGKSNNDLMLRNGSVASCPINGTYYDSKCIHSSFGESWRIRPDESLFWYRPGLSSRLYTDQQYTPIFDVPYNEAVAEICGSDRACAFDFFATGRLDIANATRDALSQTTNIRKSLAARPPIINGSLSWYARVNAPRTEKYSIISFNNDAFNLQVLESPANCSITQLDNSSYFVSWQPEPEDVFENRTLRLVAIDSTESMSSAEFVVKIHLCRACNHGDCNYTIVDANGYVTPEYIIYTCICEAGWTGPDCDVPYEGCNGSTHCSASYCPADYGAAYAISDNHTCSLTCESGFTSSAQLNDASEIIEQLYCIDTDECVTVNDSFCPYGTCVNLPGTFTCTCNDGYILGVNDSEECVDIDECALGLYTSAVCEQICINTPGSYNCSCFDGFQLVSGTGQCQLMEQYGTVCEQLNCSYACNNATSKDGSWHCICPLGYEFQNKSLSDNGSHCQDVDECAVGGRSKCSPNGVAVCANMPGSYSCSCPAGYSLAKDRLTCTACSIGTYGLNCATTCKCGDRASTCDPVYGCTNCTQGWQGEQCQVDIDECKTAQQPCPANARCTNSPGSYWCTCNRGFRPAARGELYCMDVNECDAYSPCSPYATCNNTEGAYTCTCLPGYAGDGITCTDINECQVAELQPDFAVCDPLASCANTPGSYLCSCPPGYYGSGTPEEGCSDVDECESPSTCPARLGLVCNNYVGSFVCSCADGYRRNDSSGSGGSSSSSAAGSSRNSRTDSCVPEHCGGLQWGFCFDGNQTCANNSGTYVCQCKDGYAAANGSLCEDVNECLSSSSSSTCFGDPNAVCLNSAGSYSCRCRSGFLPDPISGACVDIDECAMGSAYNNCSAPNYWCNNTQGSYECLCPTGFQLVNGHCQDIDECNTTCTNASECWQSDVCNPNAICNNTMGSYSCHCLLGFSGNGTYCSDIDECSSATPPCSNAASCTNLPGSFKCTCPSGYFGDGTVGSSCTDTDECTLSPPPCSADKHEVCQNLPGSFDCLCMSGYRKFNDSSAGGDCVLALCDAEHNGSCPDIRQVCMHDSAGYYHCTCPSGYLVNGSTCVDINECQDLNVCSHVANAACVNGEGNYSCQCLSGYVKDMASGGCVDLNECLLGPERNNCSSSGVMCINTPGGYNCTCAEGFYPIDGACRDINECVNLEGACNVTSQICVNTIGSFKCSCKDGFQTTKDGTCQDIDECARAELNNCSRKASLTCVNTPGSYFCNCSHGYQNLTSAADCVDIDECAEPVTPCPYSNTRCVNVAGSFNCTCTDGYFPSSSTPHSDCRIKDSDTALLVIQIFSLPGSVFRDMKNKSNDMLESALRALYKNALPGFSGLSIISVKQVLLSVDRGNAKGSVALAQLTADDIINVTYEIVYDKSQDGGLQIERFKLRLLASNSSLTLPDGTTIYTEINDIMYATINGSFVLATCALSGCPEGYVCEADSCVAATAVVPSSTVPPAYLNDSIDFTAIWAAVGVAAGLLIAGIVACVSVAACHRRRGTVILHRHPRGSGSRREAALTNYSGPSTNFDSTSSMSDTSSVISYENASLGKGDRSSLFFPRFSRAYSNPDSRATVSRRHSNTGSSGD